MSSLPCRFWPGDLTPLQGHSASHSAVWRFSPCHEVRRASLSDTFQAYSFKTSILPTPGHSEPCCLFFWTASGRSSSYSCLGCLQSGVSLRAQPSVNPHPPLSLDSGRAYFPPESTASFIPIRSSRLPGVASRIEIVA